MKKLVTSATVALIMLISVTACKKSTAERTTSAYYISSTISGGGSFMVTDTAAHAYMNGREYLEIEGKSTAGAGINLTTLVYAGIGTLYIDSTASLTMASYVPAGGTGVAAVHGSITFTANTPDIIGTYHFTGTDSSVYTGSFDVPHP